jgi:TolA-binding protein
VQPGTHLLRTERRGHAPLRQAVEVGKDTQPLRLKLRRLGQAALTITTDPPDVYVYLDGEFRGVTPLKLRALPPNGHHLRLEKVNFTPVTERLELADGEEKTLDRKLESRSVDFYAAQIASAPERVVNYTELSHLYMLQHRFDEGFGVLSKGLRAAGGRAAEAEETRRIYAEVGKIWEGQYDFATEGELEQLRPRLKAALEQAVMDDPANPGNYEALGQVFREEKNLDGALELFQKAYDRVTEPMVKKQLEREIARLLLQRAKDREKNKDYENAVAEYRAIVERFPTSSNAATALFQIATVYNYRLREPEKAIDAKLEYVRRFPDSDRCPDELVEIADLYRRAKEYDKAIETFRAAISQYPDYDGRADAQWMIASLCGGYLRDKERAVEEYRRFIELFPESDRCADAYQQLGSLYRQLKREEDAQRAYAALVEQCPLSQYAYYQRRSQVDRDRVRQLGQDWAQAAALVKSKDYDKAVEAYRGFMQTYPDTYYAVEAQQQIIAVYGRYLNDAEKERGEQRRFVELFPADDRCRSIQYQLAYGYQRDKRYEDATREYESLLRTYPTDDRCPTFLSTLGSLHLHYLKQYDDAVRAFRRLIRDYPQSDSVPRAYRYIGDAYILLDRLKEAKESYDSVIRNYPDSEEAYDAWRALRRLP